ncbi:hypothetical protein [Bradyrhizobium elkanii]|uniref:hypothetical protein n=1 Tax=Bradyrhizobium elkanii TaxID=29448 RepID=UPI003D207D08
MNSRDNGEQATVADAVDWDTYRVDHDPDEPSHPYEPAFVPDHGAQPRRPRLVVDNEHDPLNHYRYHDPEPEPAAPLASIAAARRLRACRALADMIRVHAPRLARYRADAIDERIDRELIPDARWILQGAMTPCEIDAALGRFIAELHVAIARHKRKTPRHVSVIRKRKIAP